LRRLKNWHSHSSSSSNSSTGSMDRVSAAAAAAVVVVVDNPSVTLQDGTDCCLLHRLPLSLCVTSKLTSVWFNDA